MSVQQRMFGGRTWMYAALAIGGIVAVILALTVVLALAHPAGLPFAGPPFGYWYPFGFFWLWPLGFIVFFFLAKWFFWGWGWRWGYWSYQDSDSARILAERYARGEITREQFEQMKKDLERQ